MPQSKKSLSDKRTGLPREVDITKKFAKDWESLSRSGKHDMHRIGRAGSDEIVIFARAGTHSELFGR